MIQFDCRLTRPNFRFDGAFETGPGITALFGPSGSGKSTVIRLLAGLDRPAQGRIVMDGETLTDTEAGYFLPPHLRRMALVFQDALLLPHLTVRQNLLYGHWFTPSGARRLTIEPVTAMLGIGHLLDRRPATLSGGERQRVAIGRALLASPRLLLMDEPLASLDTARKQEILPFIERLRDELGIPVIYVSHALEEVAHLADRVVRMEAGAIVGIGPPAAMLGPAAASRENRADPISTLTAIPGGAGHGTMRLIHPAGDIYIAGVPGRADAAMRIVVQASDVAIAVRRPEALSIQTILRGHVIEMRNAGGPFTLVSITLTGGETLHASVSALAVAELALAVGSEVYALVKTAALAHDAP